MELTDYIKSLCYKSQVPLDYFEKMATGEKFTEEELNDEEYMFNKIKVYQENIKEDYKFTQEVKDKWIEALESGEYVQGQFALKRERGGELTHCCIGVLGDMHPELSCRDTQDYLPSNPYGYLKLNGISFGELIGANDSNLPQARDYSNVLPLIKKLPVKD